MTLDQVKSGIAEIEAINLRDTDAYDRIVHLLRRKLSITGLFAFDIRPDPDVFFIRARILENTKETFNRISDHSYNPSMENVKIGRANLSGQQIFYVGRVRITALAEVNIIENKKEQEVVGYSLSRWIVNKPMKFAAILNPDTIDQLNSWELEGFLGFVKQTYEQQVNSENAALVYVYRYFANKFTEVVTKDEPHKYKITCAFSNLIYNFYKDVAGILYQSVKHPDTYNLAIKKEYIDQGYFVPTHFIKDIYKRTNVTEVTEISTQTASSFDLNTGIITW